MYRFLVLFLGFSLVLICGCNTSRAPKVDAAEASAPFLFYEETPMEVEEGGDAEPPKVASTISELLATVDVLQVPLSYAYEDPINLRSLREEAALSDELIDSLGVYHIGRWIDDLSGVLWLSCELDLSDNFRTLVFSIEIEGEGKNALVNFTNDFEFIDYEYITYADYVEGYFDESARIERDQITLYQSTYNDTIPRIDTVFFAIDERGFIDTLRVVEKRLKRVGGQNAEGRILLQKLKLDVGSKPELDIIDFQSAHSGGLSVYKYQNRKIAIGNYRYTEAGGLSSHDSKEDYGLRLLLFNDEDDLLSVSKGCFDIWRLSPVFYSIGDQEGLLILAEMSDEEDRGVKVYVLTDDTFNYLGQIDLLAYNEGHSISALPIIDVYRFGEHDFEFAFSSEYLWKVNEADYSFSKVPAEDYSYRYFGGDWSLIVH